ncbi:MAG TPA: hypothetical protein DDY20_07510 [Desulfobulbaceae bacterium]|nr:hypothetical protein [Desulfobulbaceae bacterium]
MLLSAWKKQEKADKVLPASCCSLRCLLATTNLPVAWQQAPLPSKPLFRKRALNGCRRCISGDEA